MGIINVKISDEIEQEFRIAVLKNKGAKKGAIGESVEEALKMWIKSLNTWYLVNFFYLPYTVP